MGVSFFPMDTFDRACIDSLVDAIFGTSFRKDHKSFLGFLVKAENVGAKFDTALATDAFFRINIDNIAHDRRSLICD
jgi:NAD(P)H-hydrate repair Nnr-like enzyme with NAD(P)H-hydrate epimerase domain